MNMFSTYTDYLHADYIHLSGRFGIIAASQLPFHYMLTLKTSHSPVQVVAQTCVDSLVQIHKQLGYITTLFFCIHTALYVNFFVQMKLLPGKLTQRYIQCGLIGMIAFAVIAVTALKPIRNRSYRIFYVSHVVLSILLVPFLYFHGQHMRIYLWETLAVYTVNRLLRLWSRTTHVGTVKKVGGADLVEIKIPLTTRTDKNKFSWQPGQWAYVSVAGNPLLGILRSNPFTIASNAVADEEIRFVARVLAGNTAKMTRFHSFEGTLKLSVEGPYGNISRQQALLNCSRVLFVAGGIGGTFISPLYRQLLLYNQDHTQDGPPIDFDFVWIARSMADVSWALPEDDTEMERFASRLHVHLTRTESARSSTAENQTTDGGEKQVSLTPSEYRDTVSSDEQNRLLSSGDFSEKRTTDGLSVVAGRPDLARLVEPLFSHSETERVAVVVCGPPQLTRSLRKEVGHWIAQGRDCLWWGETFGH